MPLPIPVTSHEGLDNKTLKLWTRWANTDAVAAMNCPHCGEPFGKPCRQPNKRLARIPHTERTKALFDTGYDHNRLNRVLYETSL
jgi:hypothetical protein